MNILIVGGAKGIGKAAVRRLQRGADRLVVADRDAAALEALAAEQGDVETVVMDMADHQSVIAALRTVREKVGTLDAVVISAGVHHTYPVEFVPDALIEHIIDINLTSHIKLVRDVMPLMNDGGRIVGISSVSAGIGIPMEGVYAASKAGLERVYEALSIEASYRRIYPVIIQPGNVNTGFNETGNDYAPRGVPFIDDGYARILKATNSANGIDPDDVAKAIEKAVRAKRPAVRYIVGMNAMKAHWANRLLGLDKALKVMAKLFGF